MRRFTLLTHAFSKKWEHHAAMVALYFKCDHCARVPQTLRIILAMEARIADHVEPDEQHSATLEFRANLRRDPAVAIGIALTDKTGLSFPANSGERPVNLGIGRHLHPYGPGSDF